MSGETICHFQKRSLITGFKIVGCFFSCSVAILNLQSILMVIETNCTKVRIGLDFDRHILCCMSTLHFIIYVV